MTVLVTGATGFIGRAVVDTLQKNNVAVKAMVREGCSSLKQTDKLTVVNIRTINKNTDFIQILSDCTTVIHCAARVHVMNDEVANPLEAFREINTDGTLNLAQQAANAGVKRFIFMSSIKVLGEETSLGKPFKNTDTSNPIDPYAISKFEAEEALKKIAQDTGMEVVIIRPPLVYGPKVKGNFLSMLKLASSGLPLPFSSIKHNLRSLVSVDNLVDLMIACIDHPNAANQVFLVSDDEDLSTANMFQQLNTAFGRRGLMLPIPVFVFKLLGKLTGKLGVIERLCGNLQVDIIETKSLLEWEPKLTVQEGFLKTVDDFLKNRRAIK